MSERSQVSCPVCAATVDALRARHLVVRDGRVLAYCSEDCKARAVERGLASESPGALDPEPAPIVMEAEPGPGHERRSPGRRGLGADDAPRTAPESRRGPARWRYFAAAAALVIGGGVLLGARVSFDSRTATAALDRAKAGAAAPASKEPEAEADDGMYGPPLPPPEFLAESDKWVHPLPGPVRRLPERITRLFGAERDHDSPESCRAGHCGVDIGEVKGEPVLAVHDGVVERVVRDENEGAGGRYVRLLHYGGRVVTQYMHLDTVEEALRPGYHVRAGERVGTVGDTGTHDSGPHLHFSFATRSGEGQPEVYVDPLALLTVWPLATR